MENKYSLLIVKTIHNFHIVTRAKKHIIEFITYKTNFNLASIIFNNLLQSE